MRILFADQFSEFGGAQIGLRDVLEETLRRGWHAEVMAPGDGPLRSECGNRGIPWHDLPLARYATGRKTTGDFCRYWFDSLRSGRAVRDAARSFHPDLIYVNGPRVLPATVIATGYRSIPIIFHMHSYLDREYTRRIARWCVDRRRMKVLAISQFAATPFAHLAADGRLRIIYNGVRDHGFVPRPRPKPRYIGIVGRISLQKGHLDFVRAAKMMALMRPELRFAVYGAESLFHGEYEQEVRAAADGAPVEFRGWTDDVPAALREIDILAVPSGPAEGATRVIMEAFSAGTPVVAYPSGGIPELVSHGETGVLTRGPGHVLLADALGSLLDDPALMERLSVQGRRKWEAGFRLERCQREICDYIEETLTSQVAACAHDLPALQATSGIHSEPRASEPRRGARRARL